jgi:hypothetical protein
MNRIVLAAMAATIAIAATAATVDAQQAPKKKVDPPGQGQGQGQGKAAAEGPAPTDFQAELGRQRIVLRWTGTEEATGYMVLKAVGEGEFLELAATAASDTTYSDGHLAPATTYGYAVQALYAKLEPGTSEPVFVTTPQPPAAPAGLGATPVLRLLHYGQPQDQACGKDVGSLWSPTLIFDQAPQVEVSVTIEWNPSPGAQGYRVFLGPPTDRRELTSAPTASTRFTHVTTRPLFHYLVNPETMTYWVLPVYPERMQYWSEPEQVVLTSDLKFCE